MHHWTRIQSRVNWECQNRPIWIFSKWGIVIHAAWIHGEVCKEAISTWLLMMFAFKSHITEWRLVILQAQGMLPWQSLVDVSWYLEHANYKNKRNFEVAIVFIFFIYNWSKVTKHFLRLIAFCRNSKRILTMVHDHFSVPTFNLLHFLPSLPKLCLCMEDH